MKYFFSLVTFFFLVFAQAQSIEIYLEYEGEPIGANLAGTTIEHNCDDLWDCSMEILIKNITGETINIGLERHKLIDAAESEDYLSFGTYPTGADSYPPGLVSPENPFIPPLRVDLDTNVYGYLIPYYNANASLGCSLYRYYITDEDNERLDSVDINFCSTLGISEDFQNAISIYPNPAQNQLTLAGDGIDMHGELKIMDITGKIVYSEMIQNTDKHSIDIALLDKGIYSVTLFDPLENEQIFNTKLVLE